ncbi:hypothetical protein Tco_0996023 [Tanacetum coccineum]
MPKEINSERAQEKEKLVTQLGKTEMEKFDSIRKLLPTVNLWAEMEGFDAYADTKIKVEYDKLFEKRYPYVEKISRGFRHSIFDLLKVYPDSPPSVQDSPSKHPSGKAPSTSAPHQP